MLVTGFGGVAENRPAFLTDEVHVVFACSEIVSSDGSGSSPGPSEAQIGEAFHYAWQEPDGRYRLSVYPALWLGECVPS